MSSDREGPILAALDALGIAYELHRHPPVATVADSQRLRGDIPCLHLKNLFLRDKRERMWLVTTLEDRTVDIRGLRGALGTSGNPSFGSADRLQRYLNVLPGSVTALAAVHDTRREVQVVLDEDLRGGRIGAHPGHNAATVVLDTVDLERYLVHTGHPPLFLRIPRE